MQLFGSSLLRLCCVGFSFSKLLGIFHSRRATIESILCREVMFSPLGAKRPVFAYCFVKYVFRWVLRTKQRTRITSIVCKIIANKKLSNKAKHLLVQCPGENANRPQCNQKQTFFKCIDILITACFEFIVWLIEWLRQTTKANDMLSPSHTHTQEGKSIYVAFNEGNLWWWNTKKKELAY